MIIDTIYRENKGERIPGKVLNAIIHNGSYFLSEIRVYKDGMVDCWGLVTYEIFKQKISEGWVVTSLPEGVELHIHELGVFTANNVRSYVKETEFIKEVRDVIRKLNDEKTSFELCREALFAFNVEQTEENRTRLRVAYEDVPEHNRTYLGDMDVKDIPIRMIIYGEAEIEKWSHRVVGRKMGVKPLPSIQVDGALPSQHKPAWWRFWNRK